MTQNIIDFKSAREAVAKKEKTINEEYTTEQFSADFAVTVASDVAEVLAELGYDIRDNPDSVKDLMCLMENLKSLIYRTRGVKYTFQDIPNAMYKDMFESGLYKEKELLDLFIADMELELD